eukprot:Hpha_TRINITY_DN10793_c0_g2::TRINITY_DN10793_c0_g2_i1::g.43525::m.43525
MLRAALLFAGAAVVAGQGECGTSCSATETCCFDYAGCTDDCWECCISQSTFCVAPRGTFQTSTCCPKWTVPCTVGSVGCCDPSTPWQFLAGSGPANVSKAALRRPTMPSAVLASTLDEGNQVRTLSGQTAYALFTTQTGLQALSIEILTGAVSKVKVSGPVQTYYDQFYGGSLRILPWDAKGARFVWADQDIAQGAKTVTVYTVDPKTGVSTSKAVSGVLSYPVGFAWDAALGSLVVGTQTATEAELWKVDPDTGAAVSLGKVDRGADESSATYYAAYITASDNGVVYRVGNKAVTTAASPGLEQFAASTKASTWSTIPLSGVPASTTAVPGGGFASLAVGSSGSFEAVSWGVNGSAKVLGQFANAHAPSFAGGPLGYTASSTGNGLFGALACQQHVVPIVGVTCKWSVYTASLGGGAVTENPLSPGFLMGGDSVGLAGFGM